MPETAISEDGTGLLMARLSIAGMHCISCVMRIESALEDVAGVLTADVDLAESNATVVYRQGTATLDDLAQAIVATGYRVTGSAADGGGPAS